jgi:hypothetical protein
MQNKAFVAKSPNRQRKGTSLIEEVPFLERNGTYLKETEPVCQLAYESGKMPIR